MRHQTSYIYKIRGHGGHKRKGGRETGPEDRRPQRRPGKPDRQTSSVVIFAPASERLNKPSQRVRETIMTSKEAMAEEMKRLNEKIEALEMKQQLEYLMKKDVEREARFKALEDEINALQEQPAAKKMPKQPAGPPPKKAKAMEGSGEGSDEAQQRDQVYRRQDSASEAD